MKTSTLASACGCHVTGGCPKHNAELYISHEPKGPHFNANLLPANSRFEARFPPPPHSLLVCHDIKYGLIAV